MSDLLSFTRARVAGAIAKDRLQDNFARKVVYEPTPVAGPFLARVHGHLANSTVDNVESGTVLPMTNIGRPAVGLYAPQAGYGNAASGSSTEQVKEVPGNKPYATFTIAAVNTQAADKEYADFVCDGVNDETEINAALAEGGNNYIKVILLDGNFTISSPIVVPQSQRTLQGMGKNVTNISCSSVFSGLSMIDPYDADGYESRSYNFNLFDLSLWGEYECDHIIATSNANRDAGTAYPEGAAGIFMFWQINNVLFSEPRYHGIFCWNLYGCTITNCSFECDYEALASGIYCVDEFDYSIIANNTFRYCNHGVHIQVGVYNVIADNLFECESGISIADDLFTPEGGYFQSDIHLIISGNFFNCDDYNIRIQDCQSITIIGNHFYGYRDATIAIRLYQCENIHISGNYFEGQYSLLTGIDLDLTYGVSITANHFNQTAGNAIKEHSSTDTFIQGNYFYGCCYDALVQVILLDNSAGTCITGNRFVTRTTAPYEAADTPPQYCINVEADSTDVAIVFNDFTAGYNTGTGAPVLDNGTDTTFLMNIPLSVGGGIGNLDDLGNVTITAPADGDVLTYDAATSTWINLPPTGGGGGGGTYTDEDAQDAVAAALAAGTHSGITVTYADTPNSISLAVTGGGGGGGSLAWMPTVTAPVLANFAWVSQGSATATAQYSGITLVEPGHGNTASARILKMSAPATPYVVTAGFLVSQWWAKTYNMIGLCFRNSSSGNLQTFSLLGQSAAPYWLSVDAWTSETAYVTQYTAKSYSYYGPVIWLRLANNGTNKSYHWSGDGFTWQEIYSHASTTMFTPNEVGFFVDAWNTGTPNNDVAMHLIHWAIT